MISLSILRTSILLLVTLGMSRLSAVEESIPYDATFPAGETKPILTPATGPAPRINGGRVFGVRPGKPMLFKVAATGQAPLVYAATGLPTGMTIDAGTGLITGRAPAQPGTLVVQVTVRNAVGQAASELRIEVGDIIGLTPPMGWNSWYAQSESVSDESIRHMANAMQAAGLVDHGWTYINVDDCWTGERDPQSKAILGNEKFPDMPALANYIHGKGMKFGVYSTPWMSTYAGYIGGSAPNENGDYSASYLPVEKRPNVAQYFGRYPGGINLGLCTIGAAWLVDRDARQFAAWGVDYVKYDWKEWVLEMQTEGPKKGTFQPTNKKSHEKSEAVTKRFHDDFRAVDRDIVLSLSPNHSTTEDRLCVQYANLWRLTGDIHASWSCLIAPFAAGMVPRYANTRPGHYGDLDMLQIGNLGKPNAVNTVFKPSPLTGAEQYFQVSLWCILHQPLLLSCDLTSLDAFTLNLITNDEVLAIDQDPIGKAGSRVANKEGSWEVWRKPLVDGSVAVGFFNLGGAAQVITVSREQLGLTGDQIVRDLWRQKDIGSLGAAFSAKVESHGAVLIRIRPQ